MIKKNTNGIIIIVLLSTFFGLASGLVGSLTVRSYFGQSATFWGELNFVNDNLERPNILISGARKVVVAQDERITEIRLRVENSLVRIYEEKATSTNPGGIDFDSFYRLGEELGMGLIVTSDGWIMTDSLKEKDFSLNMEDYVVIINKQTYNIEEYVSDKMTGFVFFRINARDLPVLNLLNENNLNPGDLLFGLNSLGGNFISTISSVGKYEDYLNISSDFYFDKVTLADDLEEDFYSTFLFNISGELALLIDSEGDPIPSWVFNAPLDSLFRSGEAVRPSLGLSYTDMSYFINIDSNLYDAGAFVRPKAPSEKNSPWILAGIEPGDLITHVNNIKLDAKNSLSKIIMDSSPGDEIELNILRDMNEFQIKAVLSELK